MAVPWECRGIVRLPWQRGIPRWINERCMVSPGDMIPHTLVYKSTVTGMAELLKNKSLSTVTISVTESSKLTVTEKKTVTVETIRNNSGNRKISPLNLKVKKKQSDKIYLKYGVIWNNCCEIECSASPMEHWMTRVALQKFTMTCNVGSDNWQSAVVQPRWATISNTWHTGTHTLTNCTHISWRPVLAQETTMEDHLLTDSMHQTVDYRAWTNTLDLKYQMQGNLLNGVYRSEIKILPKSLLVKFVEVPR